MTRVFITDDHTMVRRGLRTLLEELSGFTFVGEAGDGATLLAQLHHQQVDLLLLDISMPRLDGYSALVSIKKEWPELKVCVLTMHEEPYFIRKMLQVGADGYLIKNCPREEIVKALETLAEGKQYYPAEVSQLIMQDLVNGTPKVPLTRREKEVLKLLVMEKTTAEIAEDLNLSTHTVDSHRKNMLQKLECKTTVGLIIYALEHGLG
ncbi:MAG TPA: DNA-binding response regulator [Cytophagales bacterium]|nr:DNA-binding response regulator [Cytophagales bacterium]HAA23207.1 DNA-binding response regulator [Cytophagales bacterium]HAP64818.1 DNA-binding response regulator [Cytophagales bacterium]